MTVMDRLLLMVTMEVCWNTYPSTKLSSSLLLLIHFSLLVGVWTRSGKQESLDRKGQQVDRKSM